MLLKEDFAMKRLPVQCAAFYDEKFLSMPEAEALFTEIMAGFDVRDRRVRMLDNSEFIAETGVYMFADAELTSFDALPEVWGGRSPWPDSLARVRDRIEQQTGVNFQVARCVYYKDGSEGMGFHQDLPAYGPTSIIASLSLGAQREFVLRSVSDPAEQFSIDLAPGSLLLIGEGCQERYEHGVKKDAACRSPRLNLTFRKYGWG